MKKIIQAQFVLLLAGTLFAWFNFAYELFEWLKKQACQSGCYAGLNPFFTPCFYGAIFFTASFVLSACLLFKARKLKK